MAQKGVRSCTTVKISNKLTKCYVKLNTTAATSESSQTCSFYLPEGWSTSEFLQLPKELEPELGPSEQAVLFVSCWGKRGAYRLLLEPT